MIDNNNTHLPYTNEISSSTCSLASHRNKDCLCYEASNYPLSPRIDSPLPSISKQKLNLDRAGLIEFDSRKKRGRETLP